MNNTISFPLENITLKIDEHSLDVWGNPEGYYFTGRFICHGVTDSQEIELLRWKAEKIQVLMCFDTFFGPMSEYVTITKTKCFFTTLVKNRNVWEINVEGTTPPPETER